MPEFAASSLAHPVRNASIVGFGNIFKGDLGIGCYLVDVLGQEPLGNIIELSYLGENLHYAGAYLCDTEFVVIAGGLSLGGRGGSIHCWDRDTFQANLSWLAKQSHSVRLLAQTLVWAELSGHAPGGLLFLWIEPGLTDGVGLSPEVRKALRKTVHIIKEQLFRRGLLAESVYRLSSIHQLALLGITA